MTRELRFGTRHRFGPGRLLVMAIVNRTPDSFYDRGATFGLDQALERASEAVAAGADIVDVGGVKAAPGEEVGVAEELRRVEGLVGELARRYPQVVISVDTWRAEVADRVAAAGATLINDPWGGHDPGLVEVAARHDVALVVSHAGGLTPRTPPHRTEYRRDLVEQVREELVRGAERAVAAGVHPDGVLIDPAHDFAKNTWQSLEITRRTSELVDTGWPVLMALSNKDFIGETVGAPVQDRLAATLATTAVCAWQGARVFRAHQVRETRQVLDMVASLRGQRPPSTVIRGLA